MKEEKRKRGAKGKKKMKGSSVTPLDLLNSPLGSGCAKRKKKEDFPEREK